MDSAGSMRGGLTDAARAAESPSTRRGHVLRSHVEDETTRELCLAVRS